MRLGETCCFHCLMKHSQGLMNIMIECPMDRHASLPWLKEESARDFTPRYAQLSVRGKQVLDRLLALLPSHLKSQPTSLASSFSPALLFSICDALQFNSTDGSVEENGPSVLPTVLSKLRDWRLLHADHRYSPAGIHKLALDLVGIIDVDEASRSTSSDLDRASHTHLRIKWVGSDMPGEDQDRESSRSTPPSPPSRSGILGSAQECAYALPDLNECRSDTGHESCQGGRLGTPDSEDANAAVLSRQPSLSGFRSGCSACRHLRLFGLASNPSSPRMASVPLNDVKRFDANINPSAPSLRHPNTSAQPPSLRKTRREKHKASQSISRSAYVDENEPPIPKLAAVQYGIGISFPRQRTHSTRISNAILPQVPFSPVVTSVQRPPEPNYLLNPHRQGDKRGTSHRAASVDLRSSIIDPRRGPASQNDLHPHAPTRAQSFSHTPVKSNGVGSVGTKAPKLWSNAAGSRSSNQLPSWSETHPMTTTTTTFVKPTDSMSPPAAKASLANPRPRPRPFATRLGPSSTSTPQTLVSDMKDRDRSFASSQKHKHTSSVGALPLSPASPLVHARKWQV